MATYDIVIRGGRIVDGTGDEPYAGDVAINAGKIARVGTVDGMGAEEIDARGMIVTPGFVDVHTHYDGQITWSNRLAPSSDHGTTTVVMGNCGVGFAPMKPHQRDTVIAMMEGVEDIPGIVMREGVPFNWETFPEYLDAIEQRPADMDFAAQIPHSALRVYVMDERGVGGEATEDDLAEMRRLVAEGIEAGALGVSSSRGVGHKFRDGRPAPSVTSSDPELLALAAGLSDVGKGVFQMNGGQFALLRNIAETSGRPVSFTMIAGASDRWRDQIDGMKKARADGLTINGQAIPRSPGFMYGLDLSLHAFALNPSYQEIANLPLADKVARMRDPEFRLKLLSEEPVSSNPMMLCMVETTKLLFRLEDPPNYMPAMEESLPAIAAASGQDFKELLYDELLRDEGKAILFAPKGNVSETDVATGRPLFQHDNVLLGLGDGGAHYGMVCDAGLSTWFLIAMVRDAGPDEGIPLPRAIKLMTRDAALAVGLADRGLLAPGYKADVNVIDFDRLSVARPEVVRDLPAGGRRLIQKALGYTATIVSGEVTYRNGEATAALPGRLVRGAQPEPELAP